MGAGEFAGVVAADGLFADEPAGGGVEVDGGLRRGQLQEFLPAYRN